MVLKLPWAQEPILWAFENSIFSVFAGFWLTKLKPFYGKVRQNVQKDFNQNLVLGTPQKIILKLPWPQKRMFWVFEKGVFKFFANFWVTKLKQFSGKARQGLQNQLNSKLVIGSFLENGFTLRSKTNVLSIWKERFSVFLQFLSEVVKTIFSERKVKY